MTTQIHKLALAACKSSPNMRLDIDDMIYLAKLVVQECIQVGGPEDSYQDEWFKAKADSVNKIKQHFGID
jgi:hypothetical protein